MGPSPPAETAKMMHKGKGGKGKKGKGKGKNWTSWAREVGTRQYLKNFRKGLRWQLERAVVEMVAAPDDIAARDRWYWVITKWKSLDYGHEMVKGGPVMQEGRQMQYADLKKMADMRCLTKEEIRWNAAFMEQEAEEQRRDSASAATPATPAPDTPPWRRPRVDDAAAMAVDPPPRDRSRSPPRATRAKAAPERPPSPPPRTRLAEAKAAPNDLRGPAAAATVARDPLAAMPAAATAATRGSASAPTPGGFRWGDSWIDGDLARDELHPWSKWLLRLRGCLWVMVHHLVSGGRRNDVQFLKELPKYFLPP